MFIGETDAALAFDRDVLGAQVLMRETAAGGEVHVALFQAAGRSLLSRILRRRIPPLISRRVGPDAAATGWQPGPVDRRSKTTARSAKRSPREPKWSSKYATCNGKPRRRLPGTVEVTSLCHNPVPLSRVDSPHRISFAKLPRQTVGL